MTGQSEVDIPETGAVFTFGKNGFADNVSSRFWLKNDHPVQISCGGEHTAVITENGRLLMFGVNTCGQLGMGSKPAASKPASVKALKSEKVKLAACGRDHTVICTRHGSVYGAGGNQRGQLGLGHRSNTVSFHPLHPFCDWAPIKMLSAGCNTSAALTEDGRLFMWGDNSVGQVGLGNEDFSAQPRELDVEDAVIWVSCGYHHSAFVTVNGDLYTFGESSNGRLGLSVEQLVNHRVPQRVQGIVGHVTQVCCGGEHTVAITGEEVYTFGRGQYGQLGHGTFLFEVHLPTPLEHFWNTSIRSIACGENHTAVITDGGQLYTFGDGRHGKLGFGEENFINHFSPTLCTRFLQYNVESVSCGGHHMLILAAPRPPENQEEMPDKVTDCFLESSYTEIHLEDTFIDPTQLVPLSALSARARHREKENSVELFGDMFQKLPRLHSGFLNTSWQTCRNILPPKTLPKDITTPSSSPKPQSEATASPLLSPRSQSLSPHSAFLSSKPSSPHSQSSYTRRNKSFFPASPKSKPKELTSALLSPKSITKHNPNVSVSARKTAKNTEHRAATAKKALHDKLSSSPLPPKEPCSPARSPTHASNKSLSEEHPASPQTDGVAVKGHKDVEEKEVNSDFMPSTERKRSRALRQTAKEAEVSAEKLQSHGKTAKNSHNALPTERLKGSIYIRKEASPVRSSKKYHKVISKGKGKENTTKESDKMKPSEDRQQTLSHSKSSKRDKSKLLQHSPKTHQPVKRTLKEAQQELTEVKNRHFKETVFTKDAVNDSPFQKESIRTQRREKMKSSAPDKRSAIIKVTEGSTRLLSVESAAKEDAVITSVKPVEVEEQQEAQQLKLTSEKDVLEVKSTLSKEEGKDRDVKSPPAKKGTTPVTARPHTGSKKSVSVKSTPVKVKGKSQRLTSTPVKDQRKKAENTSVKRKGKEKGEKNETAKMTPGKTTGRSVEKQTKGKDKRKTRDSERELKSKIKQAREGEEMKVKDEGKTRSKNTEVSSLMSAKQHLPTEVRCNPISPQSPKRREVVPVSAAKSLQSSEPAGTDLAVPEKDREDAQCLTEEKRRWGEILSGAASLLPAVGMAGAATEILSEAVTSVQAFQSDSDKATSTSTTPKAKQFTKQSAITQASFSSTLSHLSSTEESHQTGGSTKKDGHVSRNSAREGEGQIRAEDMETSLQERGREDGDEKHNVTSKEETDDEDEGQEEDEEGESGSDVEDKQEGSENGSDTTADEESGSGEGEEEEGPESEEEEGEEKTSSSGSEEEDAESNESQSEEEEDSRKETSEGSSSSEEGGETAEEEEGESDESSDGKEESEVREDEEEKSSDESESTDSKSKESEQDGEGSDTSESTKSEDEEDGDEEEGETEDQEDEESTESEDEEKDSEEDEETTKSEEEEDSDSEEDNDSESHEDEKRDEEEEAGDEDDEEAEKETTEDDDQEEEEGEEDENESEVETTEGQEEDEESEDDVEENEGDEEEEEDDEDVKIKQRENRKEKSMKGNEDEEDEDGEESNVSEKEKESEEEEEDEEAEGSKENGSEEESKEAKESEGEEEEEEEEEDEDEEADKIKEEGSEEEEEEEEEEGDEEEEKDEEGEEEDNEGKDEVEGEEEEEEEDEEAEGSKENGSEEEEEESKEAAKESELEEEEEGEEEDEEVDKKMEEGSEEEEEEDGSEEDEGEEEKKERKEKAIETEEEEEEEEEEGEEDEESKEEGSKTEEQEEEEEEEGEEEEEEEEKVKLPNTKKRGRQKLPPADKQQREAPKPAPRTKQRAAGEERQDGSQQFWNNVLPQYLDLQ